MNMLSEGEIIVHYVCEYLPRNLSTSTPEYDTPEYGVRSTPVRSTEYGVLRRFYSYFEHCVIF
jgi:hypothetical protein